MTTFQIIGLIVVALLGLYVFYCIYDLGKFNKKKDRRNNHRILTMALLILAMAMGKGAWSQVTFDIQASYNSSTKKTTFTITRSGSSLPEQTINYRTVNLSAYAGQHYTAVNDTYTFPEGINTKTVVVKEGTPGIDAYKFQNGTSRSYRFEVLDVNGFQLAYMDRSLTSGTTVPTSGIFNEKTVTIHEYTCVVTDAGYLNNGCMYALSSNYFNNAASKAYFQAIGAQLRMTLSFDAKEKDDGYQYLQILFDNTVSCDSRPGSSINPQNGHPGTPNLSRYTAGFEMNTGSLDNTYRNYSFPVTTVGSNEGATNPWGYGTTHPLSKQLFKSNYRASDGRLIVPTAFDTLVIRLNASGSGNDEWYAKNVKAHIQAVDATLPTLLNGTNGITVSAGPYVKGNTFYISVPLSEMVHVSGALKKLHTSWGDVEYVAGEYSNVITFKGTINASAGTTLAITGIENCLFNDLAGNFDTFSTSSFNKTFTGVTCSESYTLAATNTSFSTLNGDYWVSDNDHLPQPEPTVYFYKGLMNSSNKVTLTKNTNYTFSWSNNTAAGTGTVTATGAGNYNGSASTTFPIRWGTYNVSFHENGSTAILATGSMSNQNFQYGVAQNLSANTFSREGFTFAGWNTQPDGSGTAYNDEEAVTGLNPEDGGTVDLYAQWTPIPWTGSGDNADDPYIIIYASQLDLLSDNIRNGVSTYSGKFFQLDTDIVYVKTTDWYDVTSTEHNFNTIGTSTYKFEGTFDGNGNTISGIRIYMPNDECQGLFGYVDGGTVKNVTLRDTRITGKKNSGGIVGFAQSSTIENCLAVNVDLKITENKTQVGIILGFNPNNNTLTGNHYFTCRLTKYDGTVNTTRIGTNSEDRAGARSVHYINLDSNITASGESVAVDNVTYYASNTTVTLGYTGTVNTGYDLAFTYNDGSNHAIKGLSFEMLAEDISVSATLTDVWGVTNTPAADGSQDHPYMITSTTGLDLLAKNVNGTDGYTAKNFYNKYFKLDDDIAYSYEGLGENESNYTAIGYDNNHYFQGKFDGDGHTISGIRINTNNQYQGLFGYVCYGEINNVILANSIITGYENVGGIAGRTFGSYENNCRVESSVTIKAAKNAANGHGGIVGWKSSGTMSGCISAATISNNGMSYCGCYGGIVGQNAGDLKDCLYTGNSVTASNDYGSIVGKHNSNYTLANNYYTSGTLGGVNGSDCNGARRARVITLDNDITLAGDQTVYNVSGLTAIGTTVLSYNNGTTTTIYSGATQDITLSYTGEPTIGYEFTGFTATNNGTINGNTLTMPDDDVVVSKTFIDLWGVTNTPAADGSQEHPYMITTTAGLDLLAKNVNGTDHHVANGFSGKFFNLGNDITYSYEGLGEDESNYTAIGKTNGVSKIFKGSFNGCGYTVSGIRIRRGNDDDQGLFGHVSGGTIKNVTLTDAVITGKGYVGGIAGYISQYMGTGGIIENCHVTNSVTINAVVNNAYEHGGIVGQANGDISGCSSAVTLTMADGLTGIRNYGGIAGYLSGDMQNCLVIGSNIPDLIHDNDVVSAAIVGCYDTHEPHNLSHNYYHGVTIGGATTGIGVGDGDSINRYDITDNDGAVPVFTITQGTDISATATVAVNYNNTNYYTAGTTITLSYSGEVPVGYMVTYSYNDGTSHAITGDSFEMPAADATVSYSFIPDIATWWGADATHDGTTEARAYIITTTTGLNLLASEVNNGNDFDDMFFKLGADITYSYEGLGATESNYTPIGCVFNSSVCPFYGTFDGCGYTVSGIRIYRGGNQYYTDGHLGLFGYVLTGTVKNVTLNDADITGYCDVGGIAAELEQGGTVQNCHVTGTVALHAVQNNANTFGGIVGYISSYVAPYPNNSHISVIDGCTSAATLNVADGLSGCDSFGGIAGVSYGTLQNCLVIGASIPTLHIHDQYDNDYDASGAIVGQYSNNNAFTLSHNYYHGVTIGNATTNIGSGKDDYNDLLHDITDNDGAVPVYTLTLGTGIATTTTAAASYNNIAYYTAGTEVTLSYGGDVPEGYLLTYSYNDGTSHTITGNSFEMPAADVTVSASVMPNIAEYWHADADHDGTTEARAYIITTTTGLNLLASEVNNGNDFDDMFFKLGADITYAHTTDWNDATSTENNYTAIGTTVNTGGSNWSYYYFSGTFDGCGHTVSGIRIYKGGNTTGDNFQGLFGEIDAATIKNVTLSDARITGRQRVGGIVGYIISSSSTIENCHVSDNVAIHAVVNNASSHGGIVGEVNYGTVSGCTSAVTISYASGLTGCGTYGGVAGNLYGNVQNCFVIGGTVIGKYDVGAVVGFKEDGTLSHNYYHNCIVEADGTIYTSGIGLGAPQGDYENEVSPVYTLTLGTDISATATAAVTNNNIAYYKSGTEVTLNYSGEVPEGYLLTYSYNDGTSHTISGNSFEMPAADVTVSASVDPDIATWWGADADHDGTTEERAYIITTTTGLDMLAREVNNGNEFKNKFFKLGADITYTHTTEWDDATSTENNYTAIGTTVNTGGNSWSNKYFRGTFNGCGHTVSGIRIYKGGTGGDDYQGLFGETYGATIKNVTLSDARITGKADVGGIVGYSSSSTIENCHVSANVAIHAVVNYASLRGGIVGRFDDGTVSGCSSAATLTVADGLDGCNNHGGIVGYINGTIENCFVIGGTISGTYNVGAVVGCKYDGTLSHNYYHNCIVEADGTTYTSGIGLGAPQGDYENEVSPVYTLTLGTDISATATAAVTNNNTNYYTAGTEITLSYNGEVPEGYSVNYSYNDGTSHAVSGNSFEMPAANATVSASIGVTPWSGSGTENDPWIISYRTQFDMLAHEVNNGTNFNGEFFKLGDDIAYDPTALDENGENYTAIGSSNKEFRGTFDGDNHTISGIRINKTGDSNTDKSQGLFGYVNGATIMNVILDDVRVRGRNQVGGIVGDYRSNATIENCLVLNSQFSVQTSGASNCGAITGYSNNHLTLTNNYYYNCSVTQGTNTNTTNIGAGGNYVSDLDGARGVFTLTVGDDITATATVAVSHNNTNYYTVGTEVTLSYNGIVPEGYLLAYTYNDGSDHTITGNSFTMPAADATVSANFVIWYGSGTENDPWIISYRTQLDMLAHEVNNGTNFNGKFFKLGDDIAYDPTALDENGENYTAIGNYDYIFKGTFDGDNHTISGIRINKTGDSNTDKSQGLFGRVYGATIMNVILDDVRVRGLNQVGGIVGNFSLDATIENCLVLNSQFSVQTSGASNCGAITGYSSINLTLTNNYYYNCSVTQGTNTNTTNIGAGGNYVSDRDGARGVHTLTVGDDINATATVTVSHNNTNYYTAGTAVTLSYNGPYYDNFLFAYNVNGTNISGNSFTMGSADAEVVASFEPDAVTWWHADADHDGTSETRAYIITSATGLNLLSKAEEVLTNYKDTYFKLGADIVYDPNALTIDNDGDNVPESNYTAIGYTRPFQGCFDGQGHTVSGIRCTDNNHTGLFGVLVNNVDSYVKNVTVADAVFNTTSTSCNSGGIVAYLVHGSVTNCHAVGVRATVNEDANISTTVFAGALFGSCVQGIISDNYYYACSATKNGSLSSSDIGAGQCVMQGPSVYGDVTSRTFNNQTCTNCAVEGYGGLYILDGGNWNVASNWVGGEIAGSGNTAYVVNDQNTIPNGCIAQADKVYVSGALAIKDGGQLITNNAVKATVEKEIVGYGDGNDQWYFIASPATANLVSAEVDGLVTATEYDLYYLDEAATYWRNYKEHEGNLNAGFGIVHKQGYLYANKVGTTIRFEGNTQPYVNDGVSVALTKEGAGWNLVGNPFPFNAAVDKAYYTLDDNGSAVPNTTTSANVPPCTGIVVKAESANETVTFTKPTTLNSTGNHGYLDIALTQANSRSQAMLDKAMVSFDEGTQLGKFYFGTQDANIYIPQGNEELAIVYSEGQGEMPVCFKARENGEYTITVNTEDVEMVYLHLIDNITGANIDLFQTPSYTFTARNDDYASRFKLVFNIQQGGEEADDEFAFISNGDLVINGNGFVQVVDVMGHQLFCHQVNSAFRLPTSMLSAGVYVLRLVNGDVVRTQKIVIR